MAFPDAAAVLGALVACADRLSIGSYDDLEVATFDVELELEQGDIVGSRIVAERVPYFATHHCLEQALEAADGIGAYTGRLSLTVSLWQDELQPPVARNL